MFEPSKRSMSLEDYLAETNQPNEDFAEDDDYIISRNSSKINLAIMVDKNARLNSIANLNSSTSRHRSSPLPNNPHRKVGIFHATISNQS